MLSNRWRYFLISSCFVSRTVCFLQLPLFLLSSSSSTLFLTLLLTWIMFFSRFTVCRCVCSDTHSYSSCALLAVAEVFLLLCPRPRPAVTCLYVPLQLLHCSSNFPETSKSFLFCPSNWAKCNTGLQGVTWSCSSGCRRRTPPGVATPPHVSDRTFFPSVLVWSELQLKIPAADTPAAGLHNTQLQFAVWSTRSMFTAETQISWNFSSRWVESFCFSPSQHCADVLVQFRHKNHLFRVRKHLGLD